MFAKAEWNKSFIFNSIRLCREWLPAFSQIWLHCKDARPHLWADLVPHQLAVDEAQRGMRLEANRLMRVKVYRVIPPHAQGATALGLTRFGSPEHRRLMEWPGREGDAGRHASLE